jgi:hyaluronan synthase
VAAARSSRAPAPEITYRPRRWLLLIPLALLIGGSAATHSRLASEAARLPLAALLVWGISLGTVVIQLLLSWLGRPYRCDEPPGLRATVIIPCYNEDRALLVRVLESLRAQTRPADMVIVVDDGSDKVSYADIIGCYPEVTWITQPANLGKKHAQVAGFRADPEADVYATIDSDSALERRALEQALRPFTDDRVAGVAGVEWAWNYSRNLLTRAIGARSLAFQLFSMSSQSTARGNVLIAPGAFSLFRGDVMREGAEAYLAETFCGMPVRLGDDTMLTLQALMVGRVVQQPTAVAFPAYPEKVSHHLRQWTRWMRASTIRQIWRLRYLPLSSYGWWFSVWQLGAFTAGVAVTVYVIAAWPASERLVIVSALALLIWPLILASRQLCISRSDVSFWSALGGVALMPPAALWYLLVLRQIRFYGIATLARQGWVTRRKVEVKLHEASPH